MQLLSIRPKSSLHLVGMVRWTTSDHVGRFLGDRDHHCVDIAAHAISHDRRIGDTQAVDTFDLEKPSRLSGLSTIPSMLYLSRYARRNVAYGIPRASKQSGI